MNRLSIYKDKYKTDYDNYRKYYLLKKYWKDLLLNKHNWKNNNYLLELIEKDKYGKYMTRQQVIEEIVNSDSELEEAYTLLNKMFYLSFYT